MAERVRHGALSDCVNVPFSGFKSPRQYATLDCNNTHWRVTKIRGNNRAVDLTFLEGFLSRAHFTHWLFSPLNTTSNTFMSTEYVWGGICAVYVENLRSECYSSRVSATLNRRLDGGENVPAIGDRRLSRNTAAPKPTPTKPNAVPFCVQILTNTKLALRIYIKKKITREFSAFESLPIAWT